jgi:hypothetical protein
MNALKNHQEITFVNLLGGRWVKGKKTDVLISL